MVEVDTLPISEFKQEIVDIIRNNLVSILSNSESSLVRIDNGRNWKWENYLDFLVRS